MQPFNSLNHLTMTHIPEQIISAVPATFKVLFEVSNFAVITKSSHDEFIKTQIKVTET